MPGVFSVGCLLVYLPVRPNFNDFIHHLFFLDVRNVCVFQFRKRLCVKKKVIMYCTFEINITSAKYKFIPI